MRRSFGMHYQGVCPKCFRSIAAGLKCPDCGTEAFCTNRPIPRKGANKHAWKQFKKAHKTVLDLYAANPAPDWKTQHEEQEDLLASTRREFESNRRTRKLARMRRHYLESEVIRIVASTTIDGEKVFVDADNPGSQSVWFEIEDRTVGMPGTGIEIPRVLYNGTTYYPSSSRKTRRKPDKITKRRWDAAIRKFARGLV